MASNPRPWLIAILVVDLVALIFALFYQLNGQPQLAPLSGMLTALFAAFLAAIIALSTVDYLNERGQVRSWVREETLKALEPVYEEIVSNIDSFHHFLSGSTTAWDQLQKQSRGIRVPPSLVPRLRSYYSQVVKQQLTHSSAWRYVYATVHQVYESQFSLVFQKNSRHTDLASLVMDGWSQLVDGDLDRLLLQTSMDRYGQIYMEMTRRFPASYDALQMVKAEVSRDPNVIELRTQSKDLIVESEVMLEALKPVLLRPWESSLEP